MAKKKTSYNRKAVDKITAQMKKDRLAKRKKDGAVVAAKKAGKPKAPPGLYGASAKRSKTLTAQAMMKKNPNGLYKQPPKPKRKKRKLSPARDAVNKINGKTSYLKQARKGRRTPQFSAAELRAIKRLIGKR